jgi:hypothetical protein
MKFSVTDRAVINWMTIGLLQMVRSFHQTFIPSAVAHTEHVTQLMRSDFANPHEHGVFFFLRRSEFFFRKFFRESIDALNTT